MADKKMLKVEEAAAILGVSGAWVRKLCIDKRVKGAKKAGSTWVMPDPPVVVDRLLNAAEAGRIMGISREQVAHLCKAGKIKGARKRGTLRASWWSIPFPIERIRGRPGRRSEQVSGL